MKLADLLRAVVDQGRWVLVAAYLLLRLPFLTSLPQYFDSPEFVWRLGSTRCVFACGHYPHQSAFLILARALTVVWEAPLALNITSMVFGCGAVLAFHAFCSQWMGRGAALVGALLVVLTPFIALCDLAGYSVGFNTFFLFLTLWASVRYLRLGGSPALLGTGVCWFLAVSGHLLVGMWVLAVPAVWLMEPRLDGQWWRRAGRLTAACALATATSLLLQGGFIGVQLDVSTLEGVELLLTRNGTGPHGYDIKLVVTTVRMLVMQLGVFPALLCFALLPRARIPRVLVVVPLMFVGLLVSNKLFHWGLVGRPGVPGAMLAWFLLAKALDGMRVGWARGVTAAVGLQLGWMFLHVVVGSHDRPHPLTALQEAGSRLAQEVPGGTLVMSERARTFSGFPDEQELRYESPDDNKRVLALLDSQRAQPEVRVFVDSQAYFYPRRKLDGYFYTFDSVFLGFEPNFWLRSYLGPVLAASNHRFVTLLPGDQFIMELVDDEPTAQELTQQCSQFPGVAFVRVTGLPPGTVVDVFSPRQALVPLRLERNDVVLRLAAALGLVRDVVTWAYAGRSGVAVAPMDGGLAGASLVVRASSTQQGEVEVIVCP